MAISGVKNVEWYINGQPAAKGDVPKSEFDAHVSIGDEYETGNKVLKVVGKKWVLNAGSPDATVRLTTTEVLR